MDRAVQVRPYGSVGNPFWVKGKSGYPAGRHRGSGGKTTPAHVADALKWFAEWMTDNFKFELDKDSKLPESVQLLLYFGRNEKIPPALRIAAAQAASKHEPTYLYTPVQVPDFASVEEAEAFLHKLSQQEAARDIDSRTVATITSRIQGWINNRRADQELELRRMAQGDYTGEQNIRITGGLPELPGTTISMPHLNGVAASGMLPLPTESINGSAQAPANSVQPQGPRVQHYYRGKPIQDPGP